MFVFAGINDGPATYALRVSHVRSANVSVQLPSAIHHPANDDSALSPLEFLNRAQWLASSYRGHLGLLRTALHSPVLDRRFINPATRKRYHVWGGESQDRPEMGNSPTRTARDAVY